MFGLLTAVIRNAVSICSRIGCITLFALCLYALNCFIILPTCSLPLVRSTAFCTMLGGQSSAFSSLLSSISSNSCKALPLPSPLCAAIGQDITAAGVRSTPALGHSDSLASVYPSYAVSQRLNELASSLEDITDALHSINFADQSDAMAHSMIIRDSSRKTTVLFYEYIADFVASIQTILTMSDYTLKIATQTFQLEQAPFRRWIIFSDNHAKSYSSSKLQLQAAFLHTINALDGFKNSSSYLSREAFEALSTLDRHLDSLHNNVTYAPITRREGYQASTELFSALLYSRHLKKEAKQFIRVLVATGREIRRLQSSILEAQTLVATLQVSARNLRALGAYAQGSEEPIQIEMATRSLEMGCASILSDLEYHTMD